MPPEVAKYLFDVAAACDLLVAFTRGKSFADYSGDALLRAGVEREFITIGEALTRAAKVDAESLRSVRGLRQIIGFRNILVHGYAVVVDATVWGVVENDLPLLIEDVRSLLAVATAE